MKKFLAIMCFSAAVAFAQPGSSVQVQADCFIPFSWTGSNISGNFDNRQADCRSWVIQYVAQNFVSVSLTVESSGGALTPSGFVNYAGTVVTGVNPNTNALGASTTFSNGTASIAWIRVNFAPVGGGNIVGSLMGWKAGPGGGGGGGGGTSCPGVTPCVVVGPTAAGAPSTTAPVQVAGNDGTNIDLIRTDTSGRSQVVGAAATGAAVAGNPVLVGGSDGTNAQPIRTDTSGRQVEVGAAAAGAAAAGNPVLVGGNDGTNAQSLKTDTTGRPNVVGAAAAGAAAAGNPVLVGGNDGTNAQSLKTDTSGRPNVVGAAASGAAVAGNPVLIGASDGTNAQSLKSTSATNLTNTTQTGVILHEKGARWSVSSVTGSNVQASASKAAGGAGVRHVADCIQFSAESTAAIAGTQLDVLLRDGATGAGTVLVQWRNGAVSTGAAPIGGQITVCGLALVGSANTAMTLEFANGLTNVLQSVTISGYDTN